MLISKKWLQEFVAPPKGVSDEELAKTITLSTVEVEETQDQAAALEKVVVGVIKEVTQHPNADRLRVCQVDVGKETVQIVCGGANVEEGMKVAVSLPGSWVRWHGEGELVEIKKTKLRGEESTGMICASAEIGLSQVEGDDDIRDLGELDAKPGTPLAEALGLDDVIFDIEHKSLTNRPDLMGHYGMAREVSALTRTELAPYEVAEIVAGEGVKVSVDVKDKDACPRYMAVALEGIEVGPSPEWLQHRLEACGVNSINNVVDVTNFVMLELGQPMHAFDADVLGGKIVVRPAKKGEEIVALDEKTYALDTSMLLITDGKKPMAIAGVMGGEGSGVSDATTRIVFESANFDPVSVRKTSTALSLRSESSARFEKALDPEMCHLALKRAVALMQELSPNARVASEVLDVYPKPPESIVVSLSSEMIQDRLGAEIPTKDSIDILSRLGFEVQEANGVLEVTIPSWRATKDVEIVEDVIEEVARIWGYDKIASRLPSFTITPPVVDSVRMLSRSIRSAMVELGAHETYQYAFVSPETLTALGLNPEDHVKLANPLAEDRPYLLQQLVPNLLESVVKNQRAFDEVSLFQVERVFVPGTGGVERGDGEGNLPHQPHHVAFVYSKKGMTEPFWEAKHVLSRMMQSVEIHGVQYRAGKKPASWQHPTRQADVFVGDKLVGVLSEVDPLRASAFGLDSSVAVFELDLSVIIELESTWPGYTSATKFPSVYRDVAFVVPEQTLYADLEAAVRKTVSAMLKSVELFDVYRGKGVEDGQKSLALHLTFQDTEGTLESETVDQEMKQVREVLEKEFGATMRS